MSDQEYVLRVREMLGLNQTDFGKRIGASLRTVQRYETSGHIPRRSMMAIQKLEADYKSENEK